jgi:hypothetical protein
MCDRIIVKNINLDKMALCDTSAAVKSDVRDIQRIWVTYTAGKVYENKRERERERDEVTKEWKNEVVHNLYSSPNIDFRYENSPQFLKSESSVHTISE